MGLSCGTPTSFMPPAAIRTAQVTHPLWTGVRKLLQQMQSVKIVITIVIKIVLQQMQSANKQNQYYLEWEKL